MEHAILSFDEIDSTNSYLKRVYSHLKDFTVVTSRHQTAGRGRRGRAWLDQGESLAFSLLIKETVREKDASLIPLLTGVSLSDALLDLGVCNSIKWPNDVLIGDKKVAGILLESVYEDRREALVVGVGVNVLQSSFPDELKDKAVSLYQATGKKLDMKSVLNLFLRHFDICYGMFSKGDDSYLDKVRERSYLTGKDLYLDYYGENRHVQAVDVASDGGLLVKEKGRMYEIYSGEATLEKNYR